MNKKIISLYAGLLTLTSAFLLSCENNYLVFSGGTGGQIVDAESTSTPKAGIAYVDVYAYTDSSVRDSDYSHWKEGSVFSPSNSYYGHTTTDTDGSFVISNIVWKETKPDFGKDADYTTIYLLYYHENYGLTKDDTVITSDSNSDTVYAELTAIRKTTSLNISIYDVASANPTNNEVLVTVSVPQNTDTINKGPKIYEQTITGNGTINISYPRWKNSEDRANRIEINPEITVSYFQNSDEITWRACANADNEAKDYSFLPEDFSVTKTVRRSPYNISLYGKATRISLPSVSGSCGDTSSPDSDGKIISMKAKDSTGAYTIDCGEVTTTAQTVGTSSTQTHGNFSGLGNGITISDSSYTGKYTTVEVQFYCDGTAVGEPKTLRTDQNSYNVAL